MPAEAASDPVHTLYTAHHGWLQGWLRHRLGDSFTAADLAHDTFLRVLSRRTRPELHEPKAFLATIARGLLIDHWRRQDLERAFLETLAELGEPLAPSPEERSLLLEALRCIDVMLDQLKPRVREAFLLSQLDGLTYAAIGARLGVSERMVQKYTSQALLHCLQTSSAS